MQKKVTLESGHELVVNKTSFKNASRLRRLVLAELVKVNMQFSEGLIPALLSKNRANVIAALSGTEVNTLKNLICLLLSSEEIEAAVFDCMTKWMLEGEAVTAETFESDDRWGDLIPCAVEVGRYVLLPFISSLGLQLSDPSDKTESESPK